MSFLSDTPFNEYYREQYSWRKAHHICVKCGQADAVKSSVFCFDCLLKNRKRQNKKYKSLTTEEKYAKSMHAKRRYDLCVAFGVCPKCSNHNAVKGQVLCAECRLKVKKQQEKQRRKAGIYPRDSYSDVCVRCGKNPPIDGKKLCGECYEKTLQNLSKANAAIDRKKHIWRTMNNIVFNRHEAKEGAANEI